MLIYSSITHLNIYTLENLKWDKYDKNKTI